MSHNLPRLLALYLIAILLTMLNLNSIGSVGDVVISLPLFEVMIIYYFAIYKHRIFGFWFVFLIGIWSDSLNGIPLGVTSLAYIIIIALFHAILQKQSPKENFKSILKEFALFISSILFVKWLVISLYYNNFYNILPILSQIIVSTLVYILMHKFFDFLTKKLLEEKDSASGL